MSGVSLVSLGTEISVPSGSGVAVVSPGRAVQDVISLELESSIFSCTSESGCITSIYPVIVFDNGTFLKV